MTDWTPDQQRDNRQRLTDALTAGEYRQTTGELKVYNYINPTDQQDADTPYYCAIGLACELSELGSWAESEGHGCLYYLIPDTPEDEQTLSMPEAVKDFYGFTAPVPAVLMKMNDDDDKDLEEIGLWLASLEDEPQGMIAE